MQEGFLPDRMIQIDQNRLNPLVLGALDGRVNIVDLEGDVMRRRGSVILIQKTPDK
ncbi:hypothetical protein [Arthrobacter psychrolactophilus]